MMKKIVPYSLLGALLLGTVLIWQQVPLPCETPIEYSLGVFDARFDLSEATFVQELAAAEALWENESGRELFRFVPGAAFRVNLIFDNRQEQTLEAQKLEDSLEKTEQTQESLEQKQEKLLARYTAASRDYERALADFKRHLDAYNSDVERWNKRGGAPPDEYEDLQKRAKALEKEQQELESKRQEVNRLAKEVNAFSAEQVAVVEKYNEQVEEYTDRYGEPGEFDQGEYAGEEINIYQYDDLVHLRAVLVHEFGHALGLGHGTDPTSLMYHLMGKQPFASLRLSTEDKAMLETQCSRTVWDIIWERVGFLGQRLPG